jgi:hypothetical protein
MADLTLLLPDRERLLEGSNSAILATWLARGDRLAGVSPGRDAALRGCFEFIGTTIPFAALTRSLDSPDAAGALWLRADPAWMMADAVTLRLVACGNMELSTAESDQLARAIKPLFGDAGFPLEATTPARWYLRCPLGAELPAFSPPQDALGDDVARHLPEGGSARRWQHLLNEAQVILHNHPVNADRARRGLPPVNNVWVWGAGTLPEWVRTPYTRVFSRDELVHALARLAKTPVAEVDPAALESRDTDSRTLVDFGQLRDVAALESEWLSPIQAAISARRLDHVELRFAGGESFHYRHAHRWRIWRRVRMPRKA